MDKERRNTYGAYGVGQTIRGYRIMTDQEAIVWLKTRIGNLMGCSVVEKDEVYALAVKALEEKQAMKEGAKNEKRTTHD